MTRTRAAILAGMIGLTTGCQDFLDVNTNPNAPGAEVVSANLLLPPMLHWVATGPQFDGRFIGRYTQMWYPPTTGTPGLWDRHGYDGPPSDNGGQVWRDVYWSLAHNLIDMMTKAEAEERWDLLGIGHVLKAYGWLVATAIHGEIIISDAFNPNTTKFSYDTQEFAYQEVLRHLDEAITLLQRSDGNVDPAYVARGDRIYNGDRAKWLKLAHGYRAIALNHFSNKAGYNPAQVIAAVDLSFSSNADDALLPYPATSNDDTNFWGRTRGNLTALRQTLFILNLMNGTEFGGVQDPRMTRMLAPSPDGVYRGLDPNIATGGLSVAQRPNNLHGYEGAGGAGLPGRYLFDDRAKFPIMTYAQLQFVKAEAALRMGNQAVARQAYQNGVSAHIDFVNARNADISAGSATQISAAEKAAFLASPEIVPPTVTLSHIMSQKFIAQFGWAHWEAWMDLRRYGYEGMDPVSGTRVFRGFSLPLNFHPDNGGMPAYRIRPRYNSEYVWNRAGLEPIGGLAPNYHTKPIWITQP
ncbi:hypothetical protein BH23GEM9_BH23GEM9_08070 [soil metagenome]